MSALAEQIDALLALNAKGAVSHPIPGLAVELLERARDTLSALSPVDGLEVVMEKICHKEQIGIWANEITSALALSDFLREEWTFDDSVDLEREIAAQLRDIIKSAITHPGLDLVASLSQASSVIAGLKEANETLMRERTSLIETKREQIERLTEERDEAHDANASLSRLIDELDPKFELRRIIARTEDHNG